LPVVDVSGVQQGAGRLVVILTNRDVLFATDPRQKALIL